MKRFENIWDGPKHCQCSTCGANVQNGMELIKFDNRERETVERLGTYTCQGCYIQSHRDHAAARKAQLDAMPRCEKTGCKHRGIWRTSGVLLCGRHIKIVERKHSLAAASLGGMALFVPIAFSRDEVLAMVDA